MYFGQDLNNEVILSLENYINFENIDQLVVKEDLATIGQNIKFGLLKPIFILLTFCDTTFDKIAGKFVKNQKFWHASIGFDYSLTVCYSFNYNPKTRESGLVYESIESYKQRFPNADCQVSCVFVNEPTFYKIKESLNYYVLNKNNTRYDFLNLFYSYIGKATKNGLKLNQVCSSFVDSLLKSVDIDITKKSTNLVKPDDLIKQKENRKQFIMYNGKVSKYNSSVVLNRVTKMQSDAKNNYFYKKNPQE